MIRGKSAQIQTSQFFNINFMQEFTLSYGNL